MRSLDEGRRRRPDISAWSGLVLEAPLTGGHRNEVWRGSFRGHAVAIRRSRRSSISLAWELDVITRLDRHGFHVPVPLPTDAGGLASNGLVVMPWIDGRQPRTGRDWSLVAEELRRLHAVGTDVAQRYECCVVTELGRRSRSVDADLGALPDHMATVILDVFASVAEAPVSLIHGDPGGSNIRIDDEDRVWLLDWDESRVDITWHDLSNLGVRVLPLAEHARAVRLSDAWETANAWTIERSYARQRFASLR
jgi:Ser/Thr protein kinase RdoA (MazF antagonist)